MSLCLHLLSPQRDLLVQKSAMITKIGTEYKRQIVIHPDVLSCSPNPSAKTKMRLSTQLHLHNYQKIFTIPAGVSKGTTWLMVKVIHLLLKTLQNIQHCQLLLT